MKLSKKIYKNSLQAAATACLLTSTHSIAENHYKHVMSPPEDLSKQVLPDAKLGSVTSHSTLIALDSQKLQPSSKNSWTQDIIVDSDDNVPLIVLSPEFDRWQLKIESPGNQFLLDESNAKGSLQQSKVTLGEQSFPGKTLQLPKASMGKWKIHFTAPAAKTATGKQSTSKKPRGFVLVKGDPKYKLLTHRNTQFTTLDSELALVAYMVSDSQSSLNRKQLPTDATRSSVIEEANVTVTLPNQQKLFLKMNDDGLGLDEIAGDGKYTATLPTHITGTYTTQVNVTGVRDDGLAFTRSASDLYPIEPKIFEFVDDAVKANWGSSTQATLNIPVNVQSDQTAPIFVAGELWGTDSKGNEVSATWVGGITEVQQLGDMNYLPLGFDVRWLTRQDIAAPYTFKNVRLQTVDTNTPIASFESFPVTGIDFAIAQAKSDLMRNQKGKTSDKVAQKLTVLNGDTTIYPDMLMVASTTPQTIKNQVDKSITVNAQGGKLLLVHGYCSGSVWNASSFTNAVEFKDYDKNRSHDQFAQLLKNFGSPYSSFGVVAHSQGGAAALHLYAKYVSGLDSASGGQLIQSVGTPYQGTALAGNLAAIGEVFGIQCGTNTDMTYSGAANWLSTIPNWARAKVDYYTTSFKDRWWAYDYCHLGTDMFLDDPEDGTTEKWAGQLSGAVNKGHKTGWCHTNGMRDTAQFKDSSRNNYMNSNAAR